MGLRVKLTEVCDNDQEKTEFSFSVDLIIGSNPATSSGELFYQISDHPDISQKHCRIAFYQFEPLILIYDLESEHGTMVNAQKVTGTSSIECGIGEYILKLGRKIILLEVLEVSPDN